MRRRIDNGIDTKTGECVRGCCEGDTSGVAAHTPGPWHIQAGEVADANGEFVASVDGECRTEHETANARLIAAAPEMLEALQAILDLQPDDDGVRLVNPDFLDGARAAITKATGHDS